MTQASAQTPEHDVEPPPQPRLVLFIENSCMYCQDVLRALEPLELNVELRDITHDLEARKAIVDATGRATVPVLRVTDEDAEPRWLHESLDIIRELRRIAGVASPAPAWVDKLAQLSRPVGLGMMLGSILVSQPTSQWLMWIGVAVFGFGFARRLFIR